MKKVRTLTPALIARRDPGGCGRTHVVRLDCHRFSTVIALLGSTTLHAAQTIGAR